VRKLIIKREAQKKVRTNLNRLIFRTINNPKRVKGSIVVVPIHQVAVPWIAKAVRTTAIAAGLKICFLCIARIYFDETARTPAQKRNGSPFTDFTGDRIRDNIRAVIYTDSVFVGVEKVNANILLVTQHTTIKNTTETRRVIGLNGSNPKIHKTKADKTRKSK
jgi:hypothetical protein